MASKGPSTAAPKVAALPSQDLAALDVTKLTPLSPEVMSHQATINIGTIGHVAHGKSTVVKGLSGIQTIKFKQEKERNITIKLGYANCKIFKCDDPRCPRPGNYCSRGSAHPDKWTDANGWEWKLERHVSFVDCPGHDTLMATMLNGAAIMDGALLLVAANETCPQPQTQEHLAAVEIMKLRNMIILQNKVELITPEQATLQQEEIRKFVKGSPGENSPIVPISAVLGFNLDIVAEYLCTQIPIPIRDFSSKPEMMIIRSFDVNKPGEEIEDIQGGVAGGSVLRGVLRVGDEIEIRPGVVTREGDKVVCTPIRTRIISLHAEKNDMQFAVPGSLIGVGTTMDPTLTRADRLVGNVLGLPGYLPDVYSLVEITCQLMKRLIGAKVSSRDRASAEESTKGVKVEKLKMSEILRVNIGSTATGAKVIATKEHGARLELFQPVCAKVGDKVAVSRRYEQHYRLIGYGMITKGTSVLGVEDDAANGG